MATDAGCRRVVGVCRVKPEKAEEYTTRHKMEFVWPEVLQTMYDCNIRNYNLFYDRKNSLIFSYFEYIGEELERDLGKMRDCPTTQQWWKTYADHQLEPRDHDWSGPPPSHTGSYFTPMEELFHDGTTPTG